MRPRDLLPCQPADAVRHVLVPPIGLLASPALALLLTTSTACTGRVEAQSGGQASSDAGPSRDAATEDGSTAASDAGMDTAVAGDDSSVGSGLVTLASNQALYSPISLAVDAVNVYWTAGTSDGRVMAVPIHGGSVVTVASGQSGAIGIAASGGSIYWTDDTSSGPTANGFVMTATGGAVATLASAQWGPWAIAASGATAFWTDVNGGTVMRGQAGSAPVTLASGQMSPTAIAVYQSAVYWRATGAIMSWQGGAVQTIAADSSVGSGSLFGTIAAGSTGVYWTEDLAPSAGGGGAIVFAPPSGGRQTLATEPAGAYGIAVDSQSVYWTTPTALVKMPLLGGKATTLATGPASWQALSVAVDSTSVYWTTSGSVMKLTPK
jgi:hypothetical protein